MRKAIRIAVLALVLVLATACGRDDNGGADVQDQVATGVAATQAAQQATADAEAAIAQAVEATVTALAAAASAEDTATPTNEPSASNPPTVVPTPTPPAVVILPEPPASPTPPSLVVQPRPPVRVTVPPPTPPALVILPGGGGGEGLEGEIVTLPGIFTIEDDPDTPIFSRQLSIQMLAYRPEDGEDDGDGIARIEIEVRDDEGRTVYRHTETEPGYCLFGGGTPDCNVLALEPGVMWPGTHNRVENRGYAALLTVVPENAAGETGNWNQFFAIDIPGNNGATGGAHGSPATSQSAFEAQLAPAQPYGPNAGPPNNLTMQVIAYDRARGEQDGDGIAYVLLRVIGPDGDEVYRKQEDQPAYCLFGGTAPCLAWPFVDNDWRWPDGTPLTRGAHRLEALVVGENGDSQTFSWDFSID